MSLSAASGVGDGDLGRQTLVEVSYSRQARRQLAAYRLRDWAMNEHLLSRIVYL